ncbi:MAG: hypothetical protein ABIF01_03085 [Candidatus Micrarchaeota archaeon]
MSKLGIYTHSHSPRSQNIAQLSHTEALQAISSRNGFWRYPSMDEGIVKGTWAGGVDRGTKAERLMNEWRIFTPLFTASSESGEKFGPEISFAVGIGGWRRTLVLGVPEKLRNESGTFGLMLNPGNLKVELTDNGRSVWIELGVQNSNLYQKLLSSGNRDEIVQGVLRGELAIVFPEGTLVLEGHGKASIYSLHPPVGERTDGSGAEDREFKVSPGVLFGLSTRSIDKPKTVERVAPNAMGILITSEAA